MGFNCVYANEWDKYAAKIYEKNFREKPDTRDIRTVDASEIPDHDLFTGGFPCQAFSIAGKRKGFEDTRGTLFFDIARILHHKKPGYFLLENVKGLLSHDNGNTFRTIIYTLYELGYDIQWQVLNSKNFGVPQNRERVFIIGHIRGERRPKIFPIREDGKENFVDDRRQLIKIGSSGKDAQGNRVYDSQGISATLQGLAGGRGAKTGLYAIDGAGRQNIATAIDANYYKGFGMRGKSRGRTMAVEDMKIRRLTPIECERLQGFPDNWTEGVSDTQRYKMLGNAVTTNVITEIGMRLINDEHLHITNNNYSSSYSLYYF